MQDRKDQNYYFFCYNERMFKKIWSKVFLFLFVLSLGTSGVFAQYWIANDLQDFGLRPNTSILEKHDWVVWTVPTLGLFVLDQSLTDYYQDNLWPVWRQTARDISVLAQDRDHLIFETVKYLYIWENVYPNKTLKRFVYASGEAIVDAYFLSQSLKYVFGRARPVLSDEGPYSWFHLAFQANGKYTSMPSTHATVYFAFSTIFGKTINNEILGDVFGGVNYFILNGDHNHWISDMWIGYLLGKAIGNYVWDKYEGADLTNEWFVYPTFYPNEGRYYPVIGFWRMF